jgi:cytochrome b561
MTDMSRTRYDTVAMILHWVTAVLMVVMIFLGEDMIEQERDAAPGAALDGFPSLHVSLGVAILILALVRLGWRMVSPAPPYPATMKGWEIALSKLTHTLFYVLMIGIPLTGWLAFSEYLQEHPALEAVRVFGLFGVPVGPLLGEYAGEIHEIGSNLAMVLFFLHVLAALKHQFIDRDGIMRRMAPR